MKYMFDSGRWSAAESWRTIRTARAEPPKSVAPQVVRGERKVVFQTALEQAQQQYTAAALIGYESRALNLFYGLSQAGKALAAGSALLDQRHQSAGRKSWKTSAHGLTFGPGEADFWSWEVKLQTSDRDSFSRASVALGSPTGFESIQLGALAAQLPEFAMEWRSFARWPRVLHTLDGMSGGSKVFYLREYEGPLDVPEVQAYADQYPAIARSPVQTDDDGNVIRHETQGPMVLLDPKRVAGEQYIQWPKGSVIYGGSKVILPDPGKTGENLHPLMTWWLLLFGFSILARYHPKEWTEALTMGSSPIASQIEFLLDAAVISVPELLARELWVPPWAVE